MKRLELMSPAGNLKSFVAAIEAGADSVYMGYLKFNARRPADNFDLYTLKKVVAFAHDAGSKIYITLNIDLKNNELQEALKIVVGLADIGVDAFIIKDLGLVNLLRTHYHEKIEYHASTQMAITSNYGAKAAKKLGFSRIVIARELSVDEITDITKAVDIETEIFVEGSMCFSVSGRCLMSSWVGGRSGNRGACTAPCRLMWNKEGERLPYFSMKDMLLVTRLNDIANSGVDSLKIEGRLKTFSWVYAITATYRKALEGAEDAQKIEEYREELKKYSARETGEGHFFGHKNLIGDNENWEAYSKKAEVTLKTDLATFIPSYHIEINRDEKKLLITTRVDSVTTQTSINVPPPPKKGRSATLDAISEIVREHYPRSGVTILCDNIECANRDIEKIAQSIVQNIIKMERELNLMSDLPSEVVSSVEYTHKDSARKLILGSKVNKLHIQLQQIPALAAANPKTFTGIESVVIDVFPDSDLSGFPKLSSGKVIASLPHVIYEADVARYETLLKTLVSQGVSDVEVNSLTALELVAPYVESGKLTIHAGIGIPVLNFQSANLLYSLGCQSVYASWEADSQALESLDKTVSGKLEAIAYARVPLFISRVDDERYCEDTLFNDKIGTQMEYKREDRINMFYSTEYFSLLGSDVAKKGIKMDSITADLRYSKSPVDLLRQIQSGKITGGNRFNFDRKLV